MIIERFLSFFFSRRTNEEDLVADEQKVWYVPPLYEYYGLFFPFSFLIKVEGKREKYKNSKKRTKRVFYHIFVVLLLRRGVVKYWKCPKTPTNKSLVF